MNIEYITNNPTSIDAEFKRLLLSNKEINIATAFIDAYTIEIIHQSLRRNKLNCKINLLVGFYSFFNSKKDLESLRTIAIKYSQNLTVKVSRSPRFHLKYYWFKFKTKEVYLIGSANFTKGGLEKNEELLVKLSLSAKDKNNSAHKIKREFEKHWINSLSLVSIDLSRYPEKENTPYNKKNDNLFKLLIPPEIETPLINQESKKAVVVYIWGELKEGTVRIIGNNFPKWENYFVCTSKAHFQQCPKGIELLLIYRYAKVYSYFWTRVKAVSDSIDTPDGKYFINYLERKAKPMKLDHFEKLNKEFSINLKSRKSPFFQKTIRVNQLKELKEIFK